MPGSLGPPLSWAGNGQQEAFKDSRFPPQPNKGMNSVLFLHQRALALDCSWPQLQPPSAWQGRGLSTEWGHPTPPLVVLCGVSFPKPDC